MEEAYFVQEGGSGVHELQKSLARGNKVVHIIGLGTAALVVTSPWYPLPEAQNGQDKPAGMAPATLMSV